MPEDAKSVSKMKPPYHVETAEMPIELLATSQLLEHWSRSWASAPRVDGETKIEILRKAVISGIDARRHDIPPALLQGEQRCMLQIAGWLKSNPIGDTKSGLPRTLKCPVEGNAAQSFERPIPWEAETVAKAQRMLSNPRKKLGSVVRCLLMKRFGISKHAFYDGLKEKPGVVTSPLQDLAISLYFDIAISELRRIQHRRWQARLLDALRQSAYPPIALYYAVQTGQLVPKAKIPQPSAQLINQIVEALGRTKKGPFEQLIDASAQDETPE